MASDRAQVDRWRVAFAMFVARLIVDADGIVDFGELKLLAQAFPDDQLRSYGFIDGHGEFTATFKDAYTEAMRELPNQLTLEEKLDLVTVFHRTCMADGELVQAELLVLREGAEALGVPLHVLSKHLEGLKSIRTVR
ncbi:MAG: TerB family tellurite resistance protein [Alphaproteobacteria bacterium]|nr:TerB family tellurite resistance protein [Alphaproteobacteria bacterium]